METALNTTQIALLEAIKASLFGTEPDYPADTDWAEVVKEAKAQTVLGIISPVIPVKDVSVEMGKAMYMRLLFEQDKLIKLLDTNDIPCVILKGFAAAQYYPKPYLRAMGDVDFLVPRDKFIFAITVLEENGYVYQHGKDQDGNFIESERHICYLKNGVEFELHHHFSNDESDINTILERAINKREYRTIDGYIIPLLPDIENGIVLLDHINHHLNNVNIGLRQIIDFELFIYRYMNRNLWKTSFLPFIKMLGLDILSENVISICVNYLGLPNNIELTKNSQNSSLIFLHTLFEDGNFGRKRDRLLGDRKAIQTIYNIRRYGFFIYFQRIGLHYCAMCKKNPLLKPFAWIYGIARTIIKCISSNVNIKRIRKQVKSGNDRHSLYKSIGVRTNKH